MDYYPLFARLHGVPCLVVGGGKVAARKIRQLQKAGARVAIIARTLEPELADQVTAGAISIAAQEFTPAIIEQFQLVYAATDNDELNREVAAAAASRLRFCNVVDNKALSSVIVPGVVDRSPIMIAVSSGGSSPVLTTRLRQQLEEQLPASLGALGDFLGHWRNEVASRFRNIDERRHFWQDLLEGPITELVLDGRAREADDALRALLKQDKQPAGEACIVGAGPGDPELLTLKAARALQSADVVIHDRLVAPAVLALARRDAEIISVGKTAGKPSISQEAINAMLVAEVRAGKRVCRLKGGDPFIFGRGGEEIEALSDAGLAWQVIPGITAASGCAAAVGVPLTHRSIARRVNFVTASTADNSTPDWPALAKSDQTVVMYMASSRLAEICSALQDAGCEPDRPAMLIENGTTPSQRSVTGDVSTLPELARAAEIGSPALLIVGAVVALRSQRAIHRESTLESAHGSSRPPAHEWLDAAAVTSDTQRTNSDKQ